MEPSREEGRVPVDSWCPYDFPRPGAEPQNPDHPRWGEKGMPGYDQ